MYVRMCLRVCVHVCVCVCMHVWGGVCNVRVCESHTIRLGLSGLQSTHVIVCVQPAMICRSCSVLRSAT